MAPTTPTTKPFSFSHFFIVENISRKEEKKFHLCARFKCRGLWRGPQTCTLLFSTGNISITDKTVNGPSQGIINEEPDDRMFTWSVGLEKVLFMYTLMKVKWLSHDWRKGHHHPQWFRIYNCQTCNALKISFKDEKGIQT